MVLRLTSRFLSRQTPTRLNFVGNVPCRTITRLESLTNGGENDDKGMRRRPYNIDLRAHLEQCDDNYRRLARLMPDLQRTDRRHFRIFPRTAALTVTFEVIHRSRYTTVLSLSLPASIRGFGDMRIKVRVYHDARTAEVIEFQGQRRFDAVYEYPNPEMRQPDEKAQVNRFLSEFLNACLRHGVAHQERVMIGS